MRKAGFTLIEILVVVAIIGILMAGALTTLTAGRSAAHAREAARGIAQMSHYATALALLRQRPVVLTFAGNKIQVQLSGAQVDLSAVGSPAQPIYQEVDGQDTTIAQTADEPDDASSPGGSNESAAERAGLFFTRQILDPDELAKEDAERTFEGVSFTVELLGDDGEELAEADATRLKSQVDALVASRSAISGWSNTQGDITVAQKENKDDAAKTFRAAPDGRVLFETNGNCSPFRVTVRETQGEAGTDAEDGPELMVVTVTRSGKVLVGEEEDADKDRPSYKRRSGRRSSRR